MATTVLVVTLEVDTDAWAAEYGLEGRLAVREDVRSYVTTTLASAVVPITVRP